MYALIHSLTLAPSNHLHSHLLTLIHSFSFHGPFTLHPLTHPLTHSRSLTHTHLSLTHSLALSHSVTQSPSQSLSHSLTHIHSLSLTHSHSLPHFHSLPLLTHTLTPSLYSPTHPLTHSLTRTHTDTQTHRHRHTHTHPTPHTTHHTHITHSQSHSFTCACTCMHTRTHNSPTITPPSLSYLLFPSCFSVLSLSLEKLVTCGVIRPYNFSTSEVRCAIAVWKCGWLHRFAASVSNFTKSPLQSSLWPIFFWPFTTSPPPSFKDAVVLGALA